MPERMRCCWPGSSPDQDGAHQLAADLWGTACPCRAAGRRRATRLQADCPADARGRSGRRQPPARRPDHDAARQTGTTRARSGGPRFPSSRPEPAVGRRHHRRPDRDGLSLSGGRRGCLEPQGGRLGDGEPSASRAGSGRPEHGPRPASATRRDPSFRPGQPIYLARVRQALQESRRTALDGLGRGRLRFGDADDNALCESFFATLECELLERRRFASQVEARMACFSFIEGFYNPTRRHSALGYRSPICYEQEMQTDRQSATP
jgi:transposase InsO family protein